LRRRGCRFGAAKRQSVRRGGGAARGSSGTGFVVYLDGELGWRRRRRREMLGRRRRHLIRSILDDVFGKEQFLSLITIKKTSPLGSSGLSGAATSFFGIAVIEARLDIHRFTSAATWMRTVTTPS
jgi:hypothetical protein